MRWRRCLSRSISLHDTMAISKSRPPYFLHLTNTSSLRVMGVNVRNLEDPNEAL